MSDHADDELESLLREKEELVEALTERLEQAAEQLDRLQRTNGDRGRWMSGGVPAELVEQQRDLCCDLERAVRNWEELQCGPTLGRIEAQLEELRDLVSRRSLAGPVADESPRRVAVAEPESPDPPATSSWEAMKAGLLAESGVQNGVQSGGYASYAPPDDGRASEPQEDPYAAPLLDGPAPVDFDTASRDDLRKAIEKRDEFIVEVLRRLRAAEVRSRPTDDWRQLEATPADLKARLESLERRLEQSLRATEVELSLERARLGREAVRLRQLEESTQKAMHRLGLAEADDDPDGDDADGQANSRWRRMLGLKRDRDV